MYIQHMLLKCVHTTYVNKNKEIILKFTLATSIMSVFFTSLNIPNCSSVLKYLPV